MISWLQVELNEIESSCEEYPLTRSFCHLISTLVESSLPVNLGAGLRVPGFQPYLNFLRDSVFLPFPTRAYRRPAEKVCGVAFTSHHVWNLYTSIRQFYRPCQCVKFLYFSPVGSCGRRSGSLPQAAAGLRAPAVRLCPGGGGTPGRADRRSQAPRTQHHVPPAQRLAHAGALSQPPGGGRPPAGHLHGLPR